MKSNIGLMQEQLPNGKIGTSLMRYMSVVALIGLFVYMYFANSEYNSQRDIYVRLVTDKVINEQSFNMLIGQLIRFEKWIVAAFLVAAFAPKAIQKYIENKSLTKEL